MWELTFHYSCLERPDKVFEAIKNHNNEFNWMWPDADWAQNYQALQNVLSEPEVQGCMNIRLWSLKLENWEIVRTVFYYDSRLSTYVDLYPEEWIEHVFDFSSPLDVLNVLNDFENKRKEMLAFYHIKYE